MPRSLRHPSRGRRRRAFGRQDELYTPASARCVPLVFATFALTVEREEEP